MAQALAFQFGTACGGLGVQALGLLLALGPEVKALGQPVQAGDEGGQEHQQGEVAFDGTGVPGTDVADKSGQDDRGDPLHGLHGFPC